MSSPIGDVPSRSLFFFVYFPKFSCVPTPCALVLAPSLPIRPSSQAATLVCKPRRPTVFPSTLTVPAAPRRPPQRGGELRQHVLLVRVWKLPELCEHRVDVLECLVDVIAVLAASQHDLSGDENQQHDLRHLHTVDQTREQLGLVLSEVPVGPRETLEADGDVTSHEPTMF